MMSTFHIRFNLHLPKLGGLALLLVLMLASASASATTIAECQVMIDDLFEVVDNDAIFTGKKKKAGQNKEQITRKLISARGKLDIEEFGRLVQMERDGDIFLAADVAR
ncbi:MAG: hypothetical protein ACI88G_001300 [Woeseiaceae bacterium]|jgi:hypothetical protein